MWPLASGSSLSALCPKTNGVVSPNPEFRLVMLVGFGGFRGVPLRLDFSPAAASSWSAWAVPLHLEFQMKVCFWGCQMWPFASGSSLSALCPKANGAVSPNPEFRQFMLVGFGGFRGVPCVWNFSLLCQCVLAPQWGRPCTRNFARRRMGWFHDVLLLALHRAFRRPFRHCSLRRGHRGCRIFGACVVF